MKKLLSVLFMAAAAMAQAEDLIPVGAVNIATNSGAKTCSSGNMKTYNSLFDGTRNRWLGNKPNAGTQVYPYEVVNFTETRPLVNAYRVLRGTGNTADTKQVRQATKWEFHGSNDGGTTWTLLHEQTEAVKWYEGSNTGDNYLIDYVDCTFDNTTPYQSYRFRVTANGGDGSYVSVDDVQLYNLESADTLTVSYSGFELGEPTPAYGAVKGLKSGDVVKLNMKDTRVVDPATSRRYELAGFTIKYSDGTVVHEGTKAELPYDYTFGTRAVTVVWNWSDPVGEFASSRRIDLTVPENALHNEITDGRFDGKAMSYIVVNKVPGTRAEYGPQFLFDTDVTTSTTTSRWDPAGTTPYYAQYVFKGDGSTVRRSVTGIGLRANSSKRYLYGFAFEGSNDGSTWSQLASISSPSKIASGTWDFINTESFSHYRFVVTDADDPSEMFNLEFYNYRGDDVLEILGAPAYGKPEPDYGVVTNLAAGAALTLTAPSTEVVVSENEKSVCTGYTLEVEGEEPVSGTGTTYSYVHAGKGTALTWNFSSTYRHRVAVKGAGSVDCSPDFFSAAGTVLTITATAHSADEPFLEWQGDVPSEQANNPVLTFMVDQPRSLTAVFAAPVYVSATGNDENDGSSWARAVATVARGWELCGGAGKMYLGEGEFAVTSGLLNVTHSLRIMGMGPDKTTLLADDAGAASVPFMTLGHERALMTGVRVKGAQLASGNGAGILFTAGTVTNCWVDSCSTPGYAGGIWMEGTGTLVDSVITNCSSSVSAGGAYVVSGTFLRNLVTGCRSLTSGGAYFRSAMTVADSVFRGNSATGNNASAGGAVGCDNYAVLFTNCVFEANSASSSGVIDYCPPQVQFTDCLFTNNVATSRCGLGLHFRGRITRSRLIGNRATGLQEFGGLLGMDADNNVAGRIENCLVMANVGGQGVIRMQGGASILNCTIVSNQISSLGALCVQNVFNEKGETNAGWVRNSIVAGNYSAADGVVSNWTGSAASRAVYSCIPGHDPSVLGEGSISADPRFTNAANGDYTLKASSPCVNAGANSYVAVGEKDLLGNPRIHVFGGKSKYDVVDMGCYESPCCRMPGLMILVQ